MVSSKIKACKNNKSYKNSCNIKKSSKKTKKKPCNMDRMRGLMAHFHQQRRTRIQIQIQIPNPIVTLYYTQLFPLVWIRIRIPVWIVSQMVTVPILGMDLRPRDPNPNPSPLVEMSHNGEGMRGVSPENGTPEQIQNMSTLISQLLSQKPFTLEVCENLKNLGINKALFNL